jgi:transposase
MRFYAVALLGSGKSSPTVADILCIAVSTVLRAGHAYVAEGVEGLYDKRCKNGRRKADAAFRARIVEMLQRSPEHFGWARPTWTRELLCRQAAREGLCAVSVSTMRRALAYVGAHLGTPKPHVDARGPIEVQFRRILKGSMTSTARAGSGRGSRGGVATPVHSAHRDGGGEHAKLPANYASLLCESEHFRWR